MTDQSASISTEEAQAFLDKIKNQAAWLKLQSGTSQIHVSMLYSYSYSNLIGERGI
jgi:hypothetical protein